MRKRIFLFIYFIVDPKNNDKNHKQVSWIVKNNILNTCFE
ncbi:hypothetical protein PROPEN_04866 [Proteus penneri ATCC 35198]|nr:hypothetical protein PROPEN_04866 [Proteus penneri ATCC 35198]